MFSFGLGFPSGKPEVKMWMPDFWQNGSAKCGNFVRGENPLARHGIS
jgi:hypothetical protein